MSYIYTFTTSHEIEQLSRSFRFSSVEKIVHPSDNI